MTIKIILIVTIAIPMLWSTWSEALTGEVNAVCKRTISRRESRYVPYMETYKQKVWGLSYRIRSRTNYKQLFHTIHTTEAVCCEGYKNIDEICEPICTGSCTNGKCFKPDICECNRGYTLDFFGQSCEPVCTMHCIFGKCSAPETCTCDDGYQLTADNHTCEPVCSTTCENGYCAEPNVCGCNAGYEKTETNECHPICERSCVDGKCVAPDTCKCNDGFHRSQDDIFSCDPTCSRTCIFGNCTAPETCTCYSGYAMSSGSNFTCVPVCNEPCVFGNCITPDTCSCEDGYALTPQSKYVCEPLCEKECINGKCVAPNLCECIDGYVESFDLVLNASRCEPRCDDSCVNGACTAPYVCTCNSGFQYNSTTTDCDPICTEPCINGFCETPGTCGCLEGYMISNETRNTCEPICKNCTNGFCKAPGVCLCNEGFMKQKFEDEDCFASCNPECVNGECTRNGCACHAGWKGNSCEDSLFCVISKPFEDVSFSSVESHTIGDFVETNDTQKNVKNHLETLNKPACSQQCVLEVNIGSVNFTETSKNEIRYFLPMDTPCNIATAQATISKIYVSLMGTGVGIILCAMVVYAIYLTQMKKRQKMAINSGSRECVYEEELEDDSVNNLSIRNL